MFAYIYLITHESVYSSPSLLNEYFWYDKLWGPSQRVVTLLTVLYIIVRISRIAVQEKSGCACEFSSRSTEGLGDQRDVNCE